MNEIKIYLTKGEKKNEGEWVTLPMDKDELEEMMERLADYSITDHECEIPRLEIGADTSIETLNELAETMDTLSYHDYNKLCAMLEIEPFRTVDVLLSLVENLDAIELLTDVKTDEDLGRYYADGSDMTSMDFAQYGRDIRWKARSGFTDYGFVIDNR